jgi:hypothetical protein
MMQETVRAGRGEDAGSFPRIGMGSQPVKLVCHLPLQKFLSDRDHCASRRWITIG